MEKLKYHLPPLTWQRAAIFAGIAVLCFNLAYAAARSELFDGPLIVGYAICLVQLARLTSTRQCFYVGLTVGFACCVPQLLCFWEIFGPAAIALWLVIAFWIAAFVSLAHVALARFGAAKACLLIPFLWTGLEYFRSELYYLRFSWLNLSYALAEFPVAPLAHLGSYGVGFCLIAYAALFLLPRPKVVVAATLVGGAFIFFMVVYAVMVGAKFSKPDAIIGGVQMELPDEKQILGSLNKLLVSQQNTNVMKGADLRGATNIDLVVLSEYTLNGEPPETLKEWCRVNQKFLIVGGQDSSPKTNYYNTAFVISTNGEIVFKQVKCVPIQFFKDGLPAPEQKLWDSPWGKIGICICYDLSYTRVTDELIRQGAELLIVPTMDLVSWGKHQHELHGRVGPVRAAEYGVPIFRVASSGISQGITRRGLATKLASFPGEDEMIVFGASLTKGGGSIPLDRWLAPVCVGVTGIFIIWAAWDGWRNRKRPQPATEA